MLEFIGNTLIFCGGAVIGMALTLIIEADSRNKKRKRVK